MYLMTTKTFLNFSDKLIAVLTFSFLLLDSYFPQLTYFAYIGGGYVCIRLIFRVNESK